MRFSETSLPEPLLRALAAKGYQSPTPVQQAILEPANRSGDLLVSSRTGSGKTVAFGIGIADEILPVGAAPAGRPVGLVVAPTRELALQVQRELQWLLGGADVRTIACVGGTDVRREQRSLAQGAHVVVGTPGRLCDHLDRGHLALDELRVLVLDEADEMLDMGFRDELESILSRAPRDRRTLLFSATLPKGIEELASRYQRQARRIAATAPEEAHRDIEYRAHLIAPRERDHAVVNVLRYHDAARSLVFCATRDGVARMQATLAERGFSAVALSGELAQGERNRALQALRDGAAKVLVATDVAARGLDLPEVGLVVHADLPIDAAVLQHRSGRTGRAGRKGVAVLLAPAHRRFVAERLLRGARVEPRWSPVPDVESILARDRMAVLASAAERAADVAEEDLDLARELIERHGAERLVAALVRQERSRRPAPEELPLTAALAQRAATRSQRRSQGADGWRGPQRDPGDRRRERPDRDRPARHGGGGVWFRVNVGRNGHADPRWLVPLICRRGRIDKRAIGRIEILPGETRFEIAPAAAEHFLAWSRRPDRKDPSLRFEPLRREA